MNRLRKRFFHGVLLVRRLLRQPPLGFRVFGIGLSKTGTTSLTEALSLLGWKAVHFPTSERQIWLYDAATDLPIAIRYKALDQSYPNSKSVLTVRNIDSWLKSCEAHFARGRGNVAIRVRAFGVDHFDADRLRAAYIAHVGEVQHYFRDRPADLLQLNICAGEGWEKLCPFLGVASPTIAFPRANSRRRAGRLS